MQMDENNTNGAVKVNNVAANGGANLTAERLATASNEDFSRLNKDGIADIKESLLKRDGVAKEYQPTAIDIFNRTLRVNDPAINRELHDTMQDAEDMLEQQKMPNLVVGLVNLILLQRWENSGTTLKAVRRNQRLMMKYVKRMI
ncbi:hypothetical protein [Vibrio alginolyticus]|uniref:hypothetical protein n=1 Tax=Vibrio alginolyticus TaxID=663 RepID=UPI000A296410|nr:hypothetical protein [Vibrio alginolyticus]ARP11640.1 hypothetical protein K04M3_50710 [Vibrio alginolyticus]